MVTSAEALNWSMKRILLYDDSNTWGYVLGSGSRFAEGVRWPGVLAQELGDEARVIEEGLNGRTTVFDGPFEKGKNGRTYLRPCLESHRPLRRGRHHAWQQRP